MWKVLSIVGQHTQTMRKAGQNPNACIGLTKQAIATLLDKRLREKSPKAIQSLLETELLVTVYDDMNHKHYALNWYEVERNAHRQDIAHVLIEAGIPVH